MLDFLWTSYTPAGHVLWTCYAFLGHGTLLLDMLSLLDALNFCWTCYIGVGQVTPYLQSMTSANTN